MPEIKDLEAGSRVVGPLSPSCVYCAKGSKMVLFVTGLCSAGCFYCPISGEKRDRDRIFADEWELENEEDTDTILNEAKSISADGSGITGGDPLEKPDRTLRYIRFLKEKFGSEHDIHLYTHIPVGNDLCLSLKEAGLDEIRFHPPPALWNNIEGSPYEDSIRRCREAGLRTAIEVPAIPDMKEDLWNLVQWANRVGADYMNLNEFEFSDPNWDAMNSRGYEPRDELSFAVKGSAETAMELLERYAGIGGSMGLHLCTASFKDGVQLRNRIKRRAENTAKEYDVVTEEGTVLRGLVSVMKGNSGDIYRRLLDEFEVPEEYMEHLPEKNAVIVAPWVLEDIAEELNDAYVRCYLIEIYPTADEIEVERHPLPMEEDVGEE